MDQIYERVADFAFRDINKVFGNTMLLALGLGENALLSMHNSNAF